MFFAYLIQPIVQQPAGYWAVPAGAMPGGAVPVGANPYPSAAPMSYAGATAPNQGGAQVMHSLFLSI